MRYTVTLGDDPTESVPLNGRVVGDLLESIDSGSKKALRLCVEGRSEIAGTYPRLLAPGVAFTLEQVLHQPSGLVLEFPRLGDVLAPQLTSDVPAEGSALGLYAEGMRDAIEGREASDLVDGSMIASFEHLGRMLEKLGGAVSLGNGRLDIAPVVLKPATLERIRAYRIAPPVARATRVSGTLDSIRHSDSAFTIELASGGILRGMYAGAADIHLENYYGKVVVASGIVNFRSSGRPAYLEATHIAAASPEEAELWSHDPQPLEGTGSNPVRRKVQGPRSGMNAFYGKWPINVSDAEFLRLTNESE